MTAEQTIQLCSAEISKKVESGEYTLIDRPHKSKAWLMFSRILREDGTEISDHALCKTCRKVVKYHKISTSNLVKHKCYFQLKNGEQEISIVEEEKPVIEELGVNPSQNDNNNLTKMLSKWIIVEQRPYDLIQSEDFKAVLQEVAKLGSKFGGDLDVAKLLPNLSEMTKNISEIYDQCFENVKAELASIKENGFSLTTDTRTDCITNQSYMVLTAHYMKDASLNFRLLGFQALECEEITHQNISKKVNEILQRFDSILCGQSIVVANFTDFSSNTIPAIQNLPCISQLLGNALQKSVTEIAEVSQIIRDCSNLVSLIKNHLHEDILCKIPSDCHHNRWLAICKMLNSIEKHWNKIDGILKITNKETQINVRHLTAVIKTLQPFGEAIETLADDTYPTLHLVIMYLHELKKSCAATECGSEEFDFIVKLKASLRYNIEQIVTQDITILHKIALFLYPSTKKLLQFNDQEKKLIEDACVHLMQDYKHEVIPTVKLEPELAISSPVLKRRKLFSDFEESTRSHDPIEFLTEEIEFYKHARVVNSVDFDAFVWWRQQKDNFPILYKLSSKVLATPATCAAAKRILSAGCSLFRDASIHNYKEAEMEKIIFLNANTKFSEIDSYFPVVDCYSN